MKGKFSKGKVTAIATVVGPELRRIDDEAAQWGNNQAQIERLKKTIGLDERRVAPKGVTSLDLCLQAAERVFEADPEARERVDAVIFVTQTPDHFQPCNAAIAHGRLGFGEEVAAFDVNLGCSGFVYGLYLAHSMVEVGSADTVLLLAGDTLSQCVNPKDRSVASLFGDAGTATLIENSDKGGTTYFSLHTQGGAADAIKIPAGAFRQPLDEEALKEMEDEAGNVRSMADLSMDGASVFNLSIQKEPEAIRDILEYAGNSVEGIDAIYFHQANRYIIGNIAKRLKINMDKVPADTVAKYGNQSSASIPATICDWNTEQKSGDPQNVILSGFGVGFSWASCLIESFRPKQLFIGVFES